MPITLPRLYEAERWCREIAPTLEVQHIQRNGHPYLDRYFVTGWSPRNRRSGPAMFLHHFRSSDPLDQVHSHPWAWSCSLIVSGGYREFRCEGRQTEPQVHDYEPGDTNILTAEVKHRIELLGKDCWTIFLASHVEQSWNFQAHC